MRRGEADLVIAAAVAGLACVLATTGAPAILTALTGMALLAAPGYLLSKLLLGRHGGHDALTAPPWP